MSLPEYLGWAKSVLDAYGLTNVIVAGVVVTMAIGIIKKFFGD